MILQMGTSTGFPGIDTGLNVLPPRIPQVGVTVATDIGGSHARDVMRIVYPDGKARYVVLFNKFYTPDNRNEFQEFDPSQKAFPQLCNWLMRHRGEAISRLAPGLGFDPEVLLGAIYANSYVLSEAATVVPAPGSIIGNDLVVANAGTHWVKGQAWVVKTPHRDTGITPLANGDRFGEALVDAAARADMNLEEIGGGNDTALVGLAVTARQAPKGVVVAQVTSSGTNTAATKRLPSGKIRFLNTECGGGFEMNPEWLSSAEAEYAKRENVRITIETCTSFPFMTKLLEVNVEALAKQGAENLKPVTELIQQMRKANRADTTKHQDIMQPDFFSTDDLRDLANRHVKDFFTRHPDCRKSFYQIAFFDLRRVAETIVKRGGILAGTATVMSGAHRFGEPGLGEFVAAIDSSCALAMPISFRSWHEARVASLCNDFDMRARIMWMRNHGKDGTVTVPIQGAFRLTGLSGHVAEPRLTEAAWKRAMEVRDRKKRPHDKVQ